MEGASLVRFPSSFVRSSWTIPSPRGIVLKRHGVKLCISCRSESPETMVVSITGATGFIGRRLVHRLASDGHKVRVLTRSISKAADLFPARDYPTVEVSLERDLEKCIPGSTGVVNLTGTPISTRWTSEVKDEIKRSRISLTTKLVETINTTPKELRPKVLVSASAVGFYGASETSTYDETSPSGNDYLAEVCREWEAAASNVDGSVKLVLLRIGIVLDKEGGALASMVPLFKVFAGGPIGSGKQWFSWVHREDLVSLIIEALTNPTYKGVINGTAPNPVRMAEICDTLGRVLGRPSWLPVPEIALKAVLGEGASAVLDGQRVVPKRAQELGFKFKYRYIGDALKAIFAS
ncbi:epimerase family protein SDR39U1 homolog, chloroplastic [Selaginella moellendorffii]|nr:epimerase family protein SDR39U1 homolog, chloroplastic [Selaginella moellendorffii]|eukprot:XP_002973445.2 epimerase family protein SDR39U1 homolog, chloroplastic [Selaginella moellendorffii]